MPPPKKPTPPTVPLSIPTLDGDVVWDVAAVALHMGVEPSTISSYLYGKGSDIPKPVDNAETLITDNPVIANALRELLRRAGGAAPLRLWRATEVIEWHRNRPRAGIGGRRKEEP